jgi:hypothetical protein
VALLADRASDLDRHIWPKSSEAQGGPA